MFKLGAHGLICAAYEVAMEPGTETKPGSIRGVSDCTKLATEVVNNTGLCTEHAAAIRQSPGLSVVRRANKG
jgi:hypothetical protein